MTILLRILSAHETTLQIERGGKKPYKQTPTCCRKKCSRKHHLQPRNTKNRTQSFFSSSYNQVSRKKLPPKLPKELLLLLTTTTEEIPVPPHKDVRAHARTTRNAPQTRETNASSRGTLQVLLCGYEDFSNRRFRSSRKLGKREPEVPDL